MSPTALFAVCLDGAHLSRKTYCVKIVVKYFAGFPNMLTCYVAKITVELYCFFDHHMCFYNNETCVFVSFQLRNEMTTRAYPRGVGWG